MNKAELLAVLNDEFDIVSALQSVPQQPPNGAPVNEYLVVVYKRDGDKLTPRTIYFYVEDEGEASEVASWRSFDPTADPPITFEDELDIYIEQKVAEGAIEGGFIRYLAALKEFAYGIAIVDNVGTLEEIKVFLDRDAQGEIQHRIVPSTS